MLVAFTYNFVVEPYLLTNAWSQDYYTLLIFSM